MDVRGGLPLGVRDEPGAALLGHLEVAGGSRRPRLARAGGSRSRWVTEPQAVLLRLDPVDHDAGHGRTWSSLAAAVAASPTIRSSLSKSMIESSMAAATWRH